MTDPRIYWQDRSEAPTTILRASDDPGTCCDLRQRRYAGDLTIGVDVVSLTTEQARELGHALITRAIMAEHVTPDE